MGMPEEVRFRGHWIFSKINKTGWYEVAVDHWELWSWDRRRGSHPRDWERERQKTFYGQEKNLPRTSFPVLIRYTPQEPFRTLWERLEAQSFA